MHNKGLRSKIRDHSPPVNVTPLAFIVHYTNGSSPVPAFTNPENKHPKEIPITNKISKPTQLKTDNKNLTQRNENCKKNLGCLPRSAMFNVVSLTALNLNVLGDPRSYDRLLHCV